MPCSTGIGNIIFQTTVASLVVLADRSPTWRPEEFTDEVLGLHLSSQFATIKLQDMRGGVLDAQSDDPVAFLIRVHLAAMDTRRDPERRFTAKRSFSEEIFAHDWTGQQRDEFFNVLDWMMPLPENLQEKLAQHIQNFHWRHNMEFENCLVKLKKKQAHELGMLEGLAMGHADGQIEGRAEGRAEARAEALLDGRRDTLRDLLASRFGPLPKQASTAIARATESQLQFLTVTVLQASSLEDALHGAGLD